MSLLMSESLTHSPCCDPASPTSVFPSLKTLGLTHSRICISHHLQWYREGKGLTCTE